MLNFDSLHALSMLVELGDRRRAKKLAALILASADISELWTIARSAAILDNSAPHIAQPKLSAFSDSLTDERRRELVTFCAVHTGQRPRRAADDIRVPLAPLSVWHDTRPGYDEHDAQPAGLTVYPAPWQTRQVRTTAQLTRVLRDDTRQLPREARTTLAIIDHSHDEQTLTPADTRELSIVPGAWYVYDALRRRGMTHKLAKRRATKTRAQDKAEQKAQRIADDYMRTGLNVEDRTIPKWRTVFDIDDDTPTTDNRPDGYAIDYDRAARTPLRVTPCVSCFIERRPQDAPRNRHDDGLCDECRDHQRPGLPAPAAQHTARPARTVAYLNPAARAHAARAAAITAPCAAVAAHLPRAAALGWMRAYYALANDTQRAIIAQWVNAWLTTDQPQPPTTPAPVQQAPALAAA